MGDEDAEYYQSHRDDEQEWSPPVRPARRPSRRLASMISVRFSPDEAQAIREAAARTGESVSTFVRQAALRRAQRPEREQARETWLAAQSWSVATGTHTRTAMFLINEGRSGTGFSFIGRTVAG